MPYDNKKKDNFFTIKEEIIRKFYVIRNSQSKFKFDDTMLKINEDGEESEDKSEIYEQPIITEIKEECNNILTMLNDSKIENKDIEQLKQNILGLKTEIKKLKFIDKTIIERLHEQINAIRNESNKINMENKIIKKNTFKK